MDANSKRFQKGSILIATLGIVSVFSILAASLAFEGSQHSLLGRKEREHFESKVDFLSALHWVHRRVASDPEEHEDSPLDRWFGKLEAPVLWKDRFTVEARDEESKLNLNVVSGELLRGFLKKFGTEIEALQGDEKKFVRQILKRRSGGGIKSLEELLLLEDIREEDVERLRPYLTVYPEEGRINLNTAGRLVLESLVDSLAGDGPAKRELREKILEYRDAERKERKFFRSEDLSPGILLRILGLRETLPLLQLTHQLLPQVTTDSGTFFLRIGHVSGRSAEVIFKINSRGLEVLSWHEK